MIGITERGDAAINHEWMTWVNNKQPAILITKDPSKLFDLINNQMNIIVHCTITGFGESILEPNVPIYMSALDGMYKIINLIGLKRVVLRIDPIIPTIKGKETALKVFNYKQPNQRVRISFLDMYPHVCKRFENQGIALPWKGLHAPLDMRQQAALLFPEAEICGEPGFKCTGCISVKDCMILDQFVAGFRGFQRPACACLAIKKELLSAKYQCPHKCIYCYWRGQE